MNAVVFSSCPVCVEGRRRGADRVLCVFRRLLSAVGAERSATCSVRVRWCERRGWKRGKEGWPTKRRKCES